MCAGVSLWVRGLCVAALTLLALLATTAADDKRAEMSPMPFVLGSRYGRSQQPRLISPRNDRFFMSSRYGKRSDPSAAAIAAVASQARLLCAPTGVRALFRCAPAPTPATPPPHRFQHNRISTEERELGEDE